MQRQTYRPRKRVARRRPRRRHHQRRRHDLPITTVNRWLVVASLLYYICSLFLDF